MEIEILEIGDKKENIVMIIGNGEDRLLKTFGFSAEYDVEKNRIISLVCDPVKYNKRCLLKHNLLFKIRGERKLHSEYFE